MNKNNYKRTYSTKLSKVSAISSFEFLQVIKGLTFFDLTSNKKPILEVGSGIGTITKELLDNGFNQIYCYELNDFCRKKLIDLRKNYRNAKNKIKIISNLDELNKVNFSQIIIDGPISKKQLIKIVSNSSDLKLILIENYRLRQRIWVAKSLFKSKFRQQFVEILYDDKPRAAIFFSSKQYNVTTFHFYFDFTLVMLKLVPKLILHTYLNKGKILQSSKILESPFERKVPKTKFYN